MKNRRKVNEFYIGILILITLSIYIINKSIIFSGAFKLLVGKFSFYSVLIVIPAFIGGLMFFYNKKSIIAKILSILGILLLIISIVTGLIISLAKFSILQYILFIIFGILGLFFVIISFMDKEKKYVK